MAGLLRFVAFVSTFPLSSLAAQVIDCGEAVDGLRMCAALVQNATVLRVSIQNSGDRDQLLRIGSIIGERAWADKLRPVLSTPNHGDVELINKAQPPVVAGRLDPLVILVVAGGSYSMSTRVESFAAVIPTRRSEDSLKAYLSVSSALRIELRLQGDSCPLYGYPNPNMIHCWHGSLNSNTLRLGQSRTVYNPEY
jgi:hypothetical protein